MGFKYQRMKNIKDCLANFSTSTQEYMKEGEWRKGREG